MSLVRGTIGALVGAGLAGAALRARQLSKQQGTSLVDVLPELPQALREDATRVAAAATAACADGRRAAVRREGEIEAELTRVRHSRETT